MKHVWWVIVQESVKVKVKVGKLVCKTDLTAFLALTDKHVFIFTS